MKSVGCLELHSKGCLSFKSLAWRRSIYFFTTLALTRHDFFFPGIFISRRFGSCALDFPVVMTFTSGPQSQPVRFQPQFPVATFPSLNQRIVLSSLFLQPLVSRSTSVFIPSCRSRRPLSPAQDCAVFSPVYSSLSIGSLLFHQPHRMLSHLALALSH